MVTESQDNPTQCYVVWCTTGCSCCSYENHFRGPFSTHEAAEAAIVVFKDKRLLASQYSKTGHYYIEPRSVEHMPDGRLIIAEEFVVPGFVDDDPLCDDAEILKE